MEISIEDIRLWIDGIDDDSDLGRSCKSRLREFLDSPYIKTYEAVYRQVANFNKQLSGGDCLDIFGEKDDKSYERGTGYMLKAHDYCEVLDKLRLKIGVTDNTEVKKVKGGVKGVDGVVV